MGYTIHADGELMFSSTAEDVAHIALNPKLTLDINAAGSLSFVLPPGNVKNGKLKNLKNIITVKQDGEQIFRGRVTETEKDGFNQQTTYCEGQKSFLLDSQIAPYSYSGTVNGLFSKLIANHNAKVEAPMRFTVGTVDAVSASETVTVESKYYTDTNSEIESKLLGAYGGYLRDRTVGDTHYLDWVKEYGGKNTQEIKFAVNLLELRDKISAEDVFTVLYPLGAVQINEDGEQTDPLTVASVNNGLEYIQDDAAVALYGRIERSYTWNHIESASELLQKGREHLKTGVALQTLTLKAIDMHFVDGDISRIKVGDKVHIVSDPNGLDLWMVCSRIVIDLLNPENTEYTFGEKPRTLTDNVVNNDEDMDKLSGRGGGGGRRSVEEQLGIIQRWAKINVDEANAQILLSAGEINRLANRQSQAEIAIDGLNASILLKADLKVVSALTERVSSAEISINGAKAEIKLKANQTTVDNLTGRVETAESTLTVQADQISTKVSKNGVISSINQTAEEIKIQAGKINLSGYVTASQLAAEVATINNFFSGVSEISVLKATMVNCTGTMLYQNSAVSWMSKSVVTGVSITQEKNIVSVKDINGNTVVINYVTGVSASPSRSTLSYLGN